MFENVPALLLFAGKGFSNLSDRSLVPCQVICQGAALGELVNLIPIIPPGGNFRVLKIHKIQIRCTFAWRHFQLLECQNTTGTWFSREQMNVIAHYLRCVMLQPRVRLPKVVKDKSSPIAPASTRSHENRSIT